MITVLCLGIIGCGARAAWIASCIRAADPEISISIVADPDHARARQRLADATVPHDCTRFVTDADALLEQSDRIHGILIATPCHLHAPLAIKAASTRLPVFLEKPVAITPQQLAALHHAYIGRGDDVVVSFPLRMTPLLRKVLEIVRSGRLGAINHVQAHNYVPYGGVYFGQWYRDYQTTGGLWLQKATHDFDYLHQLLASCPTAVVATSSRMAYGGDMPDSLHCSQCTIADDCPESPAAIAARGDDGGMGRGDHACAFSRSIVHHDAASAMIQYASGAHAAYSHNFLSRRSAGARGARITGYLATLTFDWYTESIRFIEHHGTAIEDIKVNVPDGHHGGDGFLARNFVALMRGADKSQSPLRDGLLSAATCLAARESESTRKFEPIITTWPAPAVQVSVCATSEAAASRTRAR